MPSLAILVEQTCLALFFRGFDRLRQARALEACLRNQFIGLRHIGVMVLAAVVAESLLGDDIAERVFRIGEFGQRSEEHTSELQSLMRVSYAVLCLRKQNTCT